MAKKRRVISINYFRELLVGGKGVIMFLMKKDLELRTDLRR